MKMASRTFGFILTALIVTSLVLPSTALAGKRIGIPAESTGRGIHIEITREATGKISIPVPPRKPREVALVAVLEKSADSIRVVGSRLRVPVIIKITKNTVFKRMGQTVTFSEVGTGSAVVIVAERVDETWEAIKIIVLRDKVFRKMRIPLAGIVSAVDVAAKTVTIEIKGDGILVLEVSAQTRIIRDRKLVDLSKLRIGDRIRVLYRVVDGRLVAVRIEGRSSE